MLLGTLLTDKIGSTISEQINKKTQEEQKKIQQTIFDAYNNGLNTDWIKQSHAGFSPEIESYLNSLDEAKKKGQEVKASLDDFGDGSQFKKVAENATDVSEAMEKVEDASKQSFESMNSAEKAATSAAEGMENISKSSTSAGASMSKLASVDKAVLGTLANIAIYYAITEAITLATEAWENYANAQENAIDRGNAALSSMEDNNAKFDSMKSALESVTENTVNVNGQTISRFQQLSEGVNAVGENISLTSAEFEEYTSILNSLTDAGFTATSSVSALKRELQETQKSVNYENLEGLSDWIDSFNAQNNQKAFNSTKEVGFQQNIQALKQLQDIAAGNVSLESGKKQSWGERFTQNFLTGNILNQAGQTISSDLREDLLDQANAIYEDTLNDATFTKAIEDLADKYSLDVYTDNGEIDSEKINTEEMRQRISDAIKQEESSLASVAKQSSGFLKSLFETEYNFSGIAEEVQSSIESIFDNIDYGTISQYMLDSNGNLSEEKMRSWVHDLTNSIASNSDIQDELESLFDIDSKKASMNLDEYKKNITESIEDITKAVPQLSDSMLKELIGFDESLDSLEPAYNKIAKYFKSTELADQIHVGDLELAANLINTFPICRTIE